MRVCVCEKVSHLELLVSVTLSYLLQQLPTGLAHVTCSLQEVLARL